ncbi:DUF6541 family protein [Arthrobacter sp. GMC3]|uniref:DUF6541 family protein n=1 Tax=Arthrobacter sp. GMC3 TaxID=2058894 RepID=UPI000CE4CCD9|nr:DUF6541 family protein [Arthrobacter sp. GMC3]
MTTWLQALPAFALALLMLGVPGAAVMVALRIRGLIALCLAPSISVSIIAVSAIVAPLIHLRWDWPVVVLGTAVTTAGAYFARRFIPALRSTSVPSSESEAGRGTVMAGVVGVLAALAITTAVLMLSAVNPEQFTQGYDSVFHLNATAYAVQTGNASSFHISEFILPTVQNVFYPGAWHGLASLLVVLTGISIPAATNIMWLAVAGVVWPLGCVFLTRILVGENRTVLVAAGALAAAFPAFPYLLLQYGSAYPNTLSNAVVPVGIGLVLLIIRPAMHTALEPAMALALVVLYLPGTVTAQPNGIFSIMLVLTPLLGFLIFAWLRTGFRHGRRHGLRRIGLVLLAVALCVGFLVPLPQIRSLFNYTSPEIMTFPLGLLRNFTHAPSPVVFPAIALTLLVLVGVWLAFKVHKMRWLLGSLILVSFTYPMSAGTNFKLANWAMAPWWDNPERIAALMPLIGVPLAAIGLGWCVERLLAKSPRRLSLVSTGGRKITAVAVLVVVLAATNPGLWQMKTALAGVYHVPDEPNGVAQIDAHELALIHRLDEYTSPDDVIANNPYNGSALAMALAGRHMLFPYSSQGDLSPDLFTVRFWLNRVGSDEGVCAAATRLGVTYLLDFGTDYIQAFKDPMSLYPGVTLAGGTSGFTLVAQDGHAALYELTQCAGAPR